MWPRENKKILGQPKREFGEYSLKSHARYWGVSYDRLYSRVAYKGMTLDDALLDLGIDLVGEMEGWQRIIHPSTEK